MHRGRGNIEKPKNFKESIMRLIGELKEYRLQIIICLVLAALSSVFTILGPDKLSDIANVITDGIGVDKAALKEITGNYLTSYNEETIKEKLNLKYSLQEMKLDNSKIIGSELVAKEELLDLLNNNIVSKNIGKIIFKEYKIGDKTITINDQIEIAALVGFDNTKLENIINIPSISDAISLKVDVAKVKQIALYLFILYLASSIADYIEAVNMSKVSNNFARKLRNKITIKINNLPLKYFDHNIVGDILSRITNDVDMIAQSMNNSLSTLVAALALFIGSLVMMIITNYQMAIVAVVTSCIGFFGMSKILSMSQKYFILRQKELGNLEGCIEEVYSGLNVVKAYNGIDTVNKDFDDLNKKVYDANLKSGFLSGLMPPMMHFIGNLGYVAVCITGAILTMNGIIKFGVIVAFIIYVRLFTQPLRQIAQAFTSLQSTAAAAERVFEILDEEEMTNEENITKLLDKSKVKGDIEFKNVSFTYDDNKKPTIKSFNAKAKAGEKIAIVGPTGAGKTTMVNLLMKFYEINKGDILIDGVSTKELSRRNLHDLFTMVLQDTWLFEGTVYENITYNRKNIPLEKVKEICKTVGIDHFIKTLPNGYNSLIGDNDSISAGEKQLLTIARGMIEDAPFLILDEATSNVDTRTEELVQKAMDKLTEGRTSFIIAHRLSTIKNADLILVMKEGNIVEQGNHDELLKQNGFYAELYNSQFNEIE